MCILIQEQEKLEKNQNLLKSRTGRFMLQAIISYSNIIWIRRFHPWVCQINQNIPISEHFISISLLLLE